MRYISALVTQGSGVMGNLVVEKNGVIRTRNIPSNPQTTFQSAVRATFTSLAAAWRDVLTDVQRAGWNAYAATVSKKDALGKDIKLSGINAFVGGSAARIQGGEGPYSTTPPIQTGAITLPAVLSVTADDSSNTVTIVFAGDVPVTTFVNLYWSPDAVSPGRSSYTGPYRYMVTSNGDASDTIVFTTPVATTGQKHGWRVVPFDTYSRVGNDQTGLTTIVA